jgi:hypothetical protein
MDAHPIKKLARFLALTLILSAALGAPAADQTWIADANGCRVHNSLRTAH